MEVEVDKNICQGHTMCNLSAPQVFKLDDDGFGYAEPGAVPQELEAKATAGARACPEFAIKMSKEN